MAPEISIHDVGAEVLRIQRKQVTEEIAHFIAAKEQGGVGERSFTEDGHDPNNPTCFN